MRTARRWLVVVAAAGLALAGCGDDADQETSATTVSGDASPKGAASITIGMQDYAYAVSGNLTASDAASIEWKNTGTEFHMAAGGKLKDGKTLADVTAALAPPEDDAAKGADADASAEPTASTAAGEEGPEDPFDALFEKDSFFPGTLLSPGQSEKITAAMTDAGDYAMICFLSVEGEGAPHFTKGMVGGFTLTTEGDKAAAPAPTAEYTFSDGKVSGPATLKAGKQVLQLTVERGHEPSVARLKPGKTNKDLDEFFVKHFEGDAPPPKGLAAMAPGTVVAFYSQEHEGDEPLVLLIEVDLQPGDHAFGCVATDGDDDEDPANDVNHGDKELLVVKVA